jgi:hypothetical protein
MLGRIRRQLTYANVMATLAVFLVLGGGAYAAFHLPKNSVRSKNIVNGQVKLSDLKGGIASHAYDLNAGANTMPDSFDALSGNPLGELQIAEAGDYVINARLTAVNTGGSDSDADECRLGTDTSPSFFDQVLFDVAVATADNEEVVSLQGAQHIDAQGAVTLSCSDGGDGAVEVEDVQMTAVRVAELTQ